MFGQAVSGAKSRRVDKSRHPTDVEGLTGFHPMPDMGNKGPRVTHAPKTNPLVDPSLSTSAEFRCSLRACPVAGHAPEPSGGNSNQ
jgi:hypothetical protein